MSLWSWSTDSKTLDCQKTNPRGYHILRTHTKEAIGIKTWHHPATSSTLCRLLHLNNKQNKNTNSIISRQDDHLTQSFRCSPWGLEESDTTERLHFHFSLSCFGEGNGNPLQCSCLENPRDGGAWWAAVYGVAQSWTRLKRFSSSSSSIELFHLRQQRI